MKNVFNNNFLLTEYAGTQRIAEMEKQRASEQNVARRNTGQLRIVLQYPAKQHSVTVNRLQKTKLYIKNMVSIRCKMVVMAVLENLGLQYTKVELGLVEIVENIPQERRKLLDSMLLRFGLELLDDKRSIVVEKIKNIVVEMVHYEDELPKIKISDYISDKLNQSYFTLSRLFSEVQGITIEHYLIAQKIERAKELITYDELTLSEIAYRLHYSSVAHLSNQFKKFTGLTPSHFKNMKQQKRITLENV